MGAIPPKLPAAPRRRRLSTVDAESAARALQVLARAGISVTEEEDLRVETVTTTGPALFKIKVVTANQRPVRGAEVTVFEGQTLERELLTHTTDHSGQIGSRIIDLEYGDEVSIRIRKRGFLPVVLSRTLLQGVEYTCSLDRSEAAPLFSQVTHAVWTLTQAFANIGKIFSRSGKQIIELQKVIRSLRDQLDIRGYQQDEAEDKIGIADDRKDEVIQNLQEALYEYGDHKDGCAVEQKEPCDCGFDEILDLATQKKTSQPQSPITQNNFATLDDDAVLRARERILALTVRGEDTPRLDLQGIRPGGRVEPTRRWPDPPVTELQREETRIELLRDSAGLRRDPGWMEAVRMPTSMVTSGERRLYGVSANGIWSSWEQLFEVCPQRSDYLDVSFEQSDPSLYRMFVAPDSRIDFELGKGAVGSEQCQMVAVVPHGIDGFGGNMIIPSFDVFGGERMVIRMRSNLVRAMAFHVCCNFFTRNEYHHISSASQW